MKVSTEEAGGKTKMIKDKCSYQKLIQWFEKKKEEFGNRSLRTGHFEGNDFRLLRLKEVLQLF